MRAKLLLAVSAALFGLAVGWFFGRKPAEHDRPEAVATDAPRSPVMPPPRKPDLANIGPKWVEILPDSIYCANWRREGLRVPRREGDEDFTATWERLRKRLTKVSYRTAFAVQSPTIYGAVADTLDVLDGRREGEEGLGLSEDFGGKSVWAVVFLGNLTSGLDVTFTSATFSANELIVTVRVPRDSPEIVGEVPHLYWVPLPEVRPGLLTLRLHDCETGTDLLVVRTDIVE